MATYEYTCECLGISSGAILRSYGWVPVCVGIGSVSVPTEQHIYLDCNGTGSVIVSDIFDPNVGGVGSVAVDLVYGMLALCNGTGSVNVPINSHRIASANGHGSAIADFELIAAITDYACYVLNIDTKKTYQFDNYGFLGIGRFNGRLIGIKDDKVYDLETVATTDDGTAIEAYWEIETDFGMPAQKEIRRLFHEDDAVTVTITDSAGASTVVSLSAAEFQALPRSLVSRAFTLKFANSAGSQITFRRIYGDLNVLDMKRG